MSLAQSQGPGPILQTELYTLHQGLEQWIGGLAWSFRICLLLGNLLAACRFPLSLMRSVHVYRRIESFFRAFHEFDTIVWATFPTCHLQTYR